MGGLVFWDDGQFTVDDPADLRWCEYCYHDNGAAYIMGIPPYLWTKLQPQSFDWTGRDDKRALWQRYVDQVQNEESECAWGDIAGRTSGQGLLLLGPVGTGKTHIAAMTAFALFSWCESGMFANVPDLLQAIRNSYNDKAHGTEAELLERARTVKVLVLDDLGAEKASDWVSDRLYGIVNYRYNNLLPIIATSNVDLKELRGRLGDRIISRLYERSLVLQMEGNDYRLRLRKAAGRVAV